MPARPPRCPTCERMSTTAAHSDNVCQVVPDEVVTVETQTAAASVNRCSGCDEWARAEANGAGRIARGTSR